MDNHRYCVAVVLVVLVRVAIVVEVVAAALIEVVAVFTFLAPSMLLS